MRPCEPRWHVVEEGLDLGGDTGGSQIGDDALAVLGPRLLAHMQRAADLDGQRRERRRHDIRKNARTLAAAEDQ